MKAIFHNERQSGATLEATTVPILQQKIKVLLLKEYLQMHNLYNTVILSKPSVTLLQIQHFTSKMHSKGRVPNLKLIPVPRVLLHYFQVYTTWLTKKEAYIISLHQGHWVTLANGLQAWESFAYLKALELPVSKQQNSLLFQHF